jgi:hypothetical protein
MTTVIVIFLVGAFIFYYVVPVVRHYMTCQNLLPELLSLNNTMDAHTKKYGFDKGVDYFYTAEFESMKFRYEHLKALAEIGELNYSKQELKNAFNDLKKMYAENERIGVPYWESRAGLKALTGYRFMSGVKHKDVPLENFIDNE